MDSPPRGRAGRVTHGASARRECTVVASNGASGPSALKDGLRAALGQGKGGGGGA